MRASRLVKAMSLFLPRGPALTGPAFVGVDRQALLIAKSDNLGKGAFSRGGAEPHSDAAALKRETLA
jgi:hypothetical protein